MSSINPKIYARFDEIFSNLKMSDRIAVYHDADPDGTCSAVLLSSAIERKRGTLPELHGSPIDGERFLSNEVLELFQSKKITLIFTTDIALDEKPAQIRKASEFARVVVIDHHKLYEDINTEKILLIKPQLLTDEIEPAKYCSSKLVYDLCSRHLDISDKDWVAAVGVISDMTGGTWQEFLQGVFKKYRFSTKNAKESSDWFKTRLGKISSIISSAEVYDLKNVDVCFETLFRAKGPKEIFSSPLVQFEKEITAEIKKYISAMRKNAEFYRDIDLIYYEIKPKFNIKSPLCTIASLKHPDQTLLLVSEQDGRAQVSARRQDKMVAVNDLLEEACRSFENANAGGHIPAAGASFPAKYIPEFKKNVIELLRKKKNLEKFK